jgi:hypothetical protein
MKEEQSRKSIDKNESSINQNLVTQNKAKTYMYDGPFRYVKKDEPNDALPPITKLTVWSKITSWFFKK